MKRLFLAHLVLVLLVLFSYPSSSTATTFTRLTFQPTSEDRDPAWSPDGMSIVFQSFRSDSLPSGIWTIPASGGLATHLALVPDGGNSPAWSPDGSQIAYGAAHDIWIGPAAGGAATQLTFMGPNPSQSQPAWSPDGSTVAFTSFDTALQLLSIWKVAASGGTPMPVCSANLSHPSWSPAGTRIACEQFSMGFRIAHMAADGSDLRILTQGTGNANPAWSPDGSWIACYSTQNGTTSQDIWLLSPFGSAPIQVTNNPGQERYPAWSPDGTKIVFSANWTGDYELWIASDLFGGTAVTETTWGRLKALFR